jgi:hypothetical protein
MAEKLSITIALEGAAEIEQQLAGIGQAGTKAFADIAKAAEQAGGFKELDPKDVTAKLQQFGVTGKEAIDKITAAVRSAGRLERIAGGVRQIETGLASVSAAATTMSQKVTGAFTAVATAAASTGGAVGRVARSLGLIGSGAIVGSLGAAALAMEKTADEARVLEGNLQALFRNTAAGTAFFNQIQQSAQGAGASLQSTAKTMLEIASAIRSAAAARGFRFAPGEELKRTSADVQQLFDILQQGMKLSGARADEATKAIRALFKEIKTKGALSGDTLREFAAEFPQLANELVKFLGIPGQTIEQLADDIDKGFRKIDINKWTNAILRAGPAIKTLSDAFEPTLAQRMDAISGAWDRLLNSFGKSPASDAVRRVLDDINKGLDEVAKNQERIAKGKPITPPVTTTGLLLQDVVNEFDAFNRNIEIAKQNWQKLKDTVTDPIKVSFLLTNLTPVGLALNKILEGIEKLRNQPPVKITVPFEADPEPPFIQSYLNAIEKVKTAFKSIFTPTVAAEGAPEPPFVQRYLTAIEKVKAAFRTMFTPDVAAEGAAEPAWVQTYLGWIAKIKAALKDALTQKPEAGGQIPSGVPLMGIPPDVQARGAARIEDRRDPGLEAMRASAQAVFAQIQQMGEAAFAAIGTAAQQAAQAIAAAFQGITIDLSQSIDFNSLVSNAQQAAQSIASSFSTIDIASTLTGQINSLIQKFNELAAAAKAAAAATSSSGFSGGGQVGGFQGGGLLGGRGTGTSDSNLVRVSRGEYIVPARAVRQPGVLALLEALRHSGGNLRDVLDDMGRFALGGLVPRTIPAFAVGGSVAARSNGRAINLTIDNGASRESFRMWADEDVAEKVVRYSVARQAASAGRKSGAFG